MSDKSITINYTAKTIDGQDKLWTGFGSGMAHGLSAKVGNYTISEFKASEIFVDCVEISKYLETCDKVKTDFVGIHSGLNSFIEMLAKGAYIPFCQIEILERLRAAIGDAICKADQEGYERAVKDQQDAIENHKEYVLPSARLADRIYSGEIAGVVRPGEALLAMTDEQFASIVEKINSEPSGSLEIIDDSPFEPEERARYIAKQMINAALDEHMAKLEGGK